MAECSMGSGKVTGREAARQLAKYKTKMQMQLAMGEHDGFEALMEDIYKQFHVVVDFGDLAKDRVASSMLKIASGQETVEGILGHLKELLGDDAAKYEQSRTTFRGLRFHSGR